MNIYNRADIIDKNFSKRIKSNKFLNSFNDSYGSTNNVNKESLLSIFESQVLSRHMDLKPEN